MLKLGSLRMLLMTLFCLSTQSVFALSSSKPMTRLSSELYTVLNQPVERLEEQSQSMKSDVLAKIEILSKEDAKKFMKTFNLGELSVLPYTPLCQPNASARSQAYFSFKLPDVCGGVKVKTGLSYHLAENQKNGIGSREHVLYLVSTKALNDTRWKPFISISYMRTQSRGTPRQNYRGLKEIRSRSSSQYRGPESYTLSTTYSNVEVLETCCGLQPHEKLSLVFSFNYLKPLNKKVRLLDPFKGRVFDELKVLHRSQGLDLKVDYALKEGLNLLVKSEYLLSNSSFKNNEDKPVIIEGQLIVSF
ncbi:MAG: hypothetical protein S4CHLAM7_09990 [Chlamydiae bacterium]|nr:hypothetical protein [Chlamydiota bacterium]